MTALLALALAQPARGACPASPEPLQPLDLAAIDAADPADDAGIAEVLGLAPEQIGSVVAVEGGRAAAWWTCDEQGCAGSVAMVAADGRTLGRAGLPVPAKPWAIDGLQIGPGALLDLDGDGAAEWALRYTVTEPPRPALGSRFHEVVAVYNLPALSLLWWRDLREVGGDSEEACQDSLSYGGGAIQAERSCGLWGALEADDAQGLTVRCDRWRWRAGPDRMRASMH